jgi:hypothetical protein
MICTLYGEEAMQSNNAQPSNGQRSGVEVAEDVRCPGSGKLGDKRFAHLVAVWCSIGDSYEWS